MDNKLPVKETNMVLTRAEIISLFIDVLINCHIINSFLVG